MREALSNEVWESLNRLYLRLTPVTMDSIWVHKSRRGCSREALEEMHALEGVDLFHASAMAKAGTSWSWAAISSGCSRSAACWTCIFKAAPKAPPMARNISTGWCCSNSAPPSKPYTKLYTASIRPQKIAEFLLFDPEFPAFSICFSVDRVTEALARVAPGAPPARRAAVERGSAGQLKATVDFGQIPDELMSGGIASSSPASPSSASKIHEGAVCVFHYLWRGDCFY